MYGIGQPCPECGWWVPAGDVKAWRKLSLTNLPMLLSTRSMRNVMPMTGTPLLNTPVDLFSIYHLIDPVAFPTLRWFKETFTHPDYSQRRSVFSKRGLSLLTPLLKGRFLQRTLAEVGIFLPKQHVHVERVELDPVQYPLQARTIEQVSKHAAIFMFGVTTSHRPSSFASAAVSQVSASSSSLIFSHGWPERAT